MTPGRPTLGDVAQRAGVHKATASRALNPATAARVHPATAQRVREAADTLGYRPNMNARGLRMRSSRTVGVIVPDILSPLYPPLIRGIEQVLGEHDLFLLVADTNRDDNQETRALDNLVSRQVDGLITASSYTSHGSLQGLARTGTPVVLLDTTVSPDGLSTVGYDLPTGVHDLAALVVGAGHRRIGLVVGPEAPSNPPLRTDLHADALRQLGLDPATTLVPARAESYSIEAGMDAGRRLLAERPDITALMAHNDDLAIGLVHAAQAAGLRVPADLTVTGFNDIEVAAYLDPPLTTARLDMQRLGREAAAVLVRAIATPGTVEHHELPVDVVVRGSHGPPRRD
ncbi:LacI family DNA-binding transcriptional regulator [Jatrophihabitans sp. YIM 134969]